MQAKQFKQPSYQAVVICGLVVLAAWGIVFFQGLKTAVDVWWVSEIFNHCFLVLPAACYFIYRKREQLKSTPIKPNYWLLPLLFACLFLQLFAEIGDINLFMHAATFGSLPLLIWLLIGNQAAKVIFFPLCFMLFAIPVGEQLIPYLQEITTNMAVPLIELTQVPVFRNGLYLDIPQGRFLVAEACSGISFLIASIVFGCFYAYISFQRFYKQAAFVLVSIGLPIFANAIRVYGIVVTAYFTDMEYAAGADHIIYGGVLYTIILFLLIMVGERFRDKSYSISVFDGDSLESKPLHPQTPMVVYISLAIVALMLVQQVWFYKVTRSTGATSSAVVINTSILSAEAIDKKAFDWQPSYKDATAKLQRQLLLTSGEIIDYFIATYLFGDGELISSLNYLFNTEKWSRLGPSRQRFALGNDAINTIELVSATGNHRSIAYWYALDGEIFTSGTKLKLMRTTKALLGQAPMTTIYAFSIEGGNKATLLSFLAYNHSTLKQITTTKEGGANES